MNLREDTFFVIYDVLSISDYIESNGRIISEPERIWKAEVMA
jgi:hypothetical protein